MNEAQQSHDVDIVDLGDAKELTQGQLQGALPEDNPVAPRRDIQ